MTRDEWAFAYGLSKEKASEVYGQIQSLRKMHPTRWAQSINSMHPRWWFYAFMVDTGLREDIALSLIDDCLNDSRGQDLEERDKP